MRDRESSDNLKAVIAKNNFTLIIAFAELSGIRERGVYPICHNGVVNSTLA